MSDNFRISIHALLAESDLIALFDFPIVPVISIHALLAESDLRYWSRAMDTTISIHALLAESDIKNPEAVSKYMIFLSTLSLRRATTGINPLSRVNRHFYPRSPCGERPVR